MKQQVLFIGDLNTNLAEYKLFKEKFECIRYELTTVEKLVEDFKGKFKNIRAIYGAWLGFVPLGGFKGAIIDNAPSSLKVVSICSVGYDGYDGQRMAERGIILTNVPSHGACEPVADLVLYNAIDSFRNFTVTTKNFCLENNHTVRIRRKLEDARLDAASGTIHLGETDGYSFGETTIGRPNLSPRGHHAVIVGFGKIGQTIAKKLDSIGMVIHYVKRTPLSASEQSEFPYALQYHSSLKEAGKVADLVVIACPGTPETHHMVDKDVIESFKKPFRVINVGRGTVIDEQALVDGLKSGKVLFAGLDVFENEPTVNKELFGRHDVVLTPHVGASTVENFDYTAVTALKNIENVLLEGGNGLHKVN